MNGASFGGIYALFVGRRAATFRAALAGGLGWGITPEILQSIFYPGWLQISTTLREFLVISGLGHVVYGLTLGAVVHVLLHRSPAGLDGFDDDPGPWTESEAPGATRTNATPP